MMIMQQPGNFETTSWDEFQPLIQSRNHRLFSKFELCGSLQNAQFVALNSEPQHAHQQQSPLRLAQSMLDSQREDVFASTVYRTFEPLEHFDNRPVMRRTIFSCQGTSDVGCKCDACYNYMMIMQQPGNFETTSWDEFQPLTQSSIHRILSKLEPCGSLQNEQLVATNPDPKHVHRQQPPSGLAQLMKDTQREDLFASTVHRTFEPLEHFDNRPTMRRAFFSCQGISDVGCKCDACYDYMMIMQQPGNFETTSWDEFQPLIQSRTHRCFSKFELCGSLQNAQFVALNPEPQHAHQQQSPLGLAQLMQDSQREDVFASTVHRTFERLEHFDNRPAMRRAFFSCQGISDVGCKCDACYDYMMIMQQLGNFETTSWDEFQPLIQSRNHRFFSKIELCGSLQNEQFVALNPEPQHAHQQQSPLGLAQLMHDSQREDVFASTVYRTFEPLEHVDTRPAMRRAIFSCQGTSDVGCKCDACYDYMMIMQQPGNFETTSWDEFQPLTQSSIHRILPKLEPCGSLQNEQLVSTSPDPKHVHRQQPPSGLAQLMKDTQREDLFASTVHRTFERLEHFDNRPAMRRAFVSCQGISDVGCKCDACYDYMMIMQQPGNFETASWDEFQPLIQSRNHRFFSKFELCGSLQNEQLVATNPDPKHVHRQQPPSGLAQLMQDSQREDVFASTVHRTFEPLEHFDNRRQ